MKDLRTLTIMDIFGEEMQVEARVGETKQHGYLNKNGSWFLYGGADRTPCELVALKIKGKQKWKWYYKSRIVRGLDNE